MRKTANLLLMMILFFLFSTGTQMNSSSMVTSTKIDSVTIVRILEIIELQHRATVEKQLYDSLISKSSVKWLLTGFIEAQQFYESSMNQNAVSPEGAIGIAQFMPDTWNKLIERGLLPEWFEITNEAHQKIAQLVYLDYLYSLWVDIPNDRKALTVASYNAGPGAISYIVKQHGSEWRSHLPAETIKYLNNLKEYV